MINYPIQNAYHVSKVSPVQQQMNTSQLSFVSLTSQQQQHRSSHDDPNRSKYSPSTQQRRVNHQMESQQIMKEKVRDSSEQKVATKVEIVGSIQQNKSQLIYGSNNFNFMHFQSKPQFSNTLSTFKDLNLKISDMPTGTIFEDPGEMTMTNQLKFSKSPGGENKEWSEILTKTRNLEENLLQLKNSINKNLKKIQRYKQVDKKVLTSPKMLNESTKVATGKQSSENSFLMIKIQENDLVYVNAQQKAGIGSPMNESYFKQTKVVDATEEQNRLSKESTQSKYSTQSTNALHIKTQQSKQNKSLLTEDTKKSKLMPANQMKILILVSGAQSNHGLSHNPSMSSLTTNIPQLSSVRVYEPPKPQLLLDTTTTTTNNKKNAKDLTRVQTISRINSPLQSKLGSKDTSQNAISIKDVRASQEGRGHAISERKDVVAGGNRRLPPSKVIDPLYLPVSPLKDRIVTGQFIGRGKFSDVFLAKDTFTGFHFALKVIRKEIIREFQMEDQLAREIKIQSMMDHPNIVKLYGTFYDDEKIYLVIEYCSDGELFQHQYKQVDRKFDEIKASQLIGQILDGINYMHDQGVMHRDLKTENILLSYNQIKLCDLGCVCDISNDTKLRTTFCGTVDYIAPEVITGGGQETDKSLKGYDQRCDIWQVGVLAYELVVGRTPFTDSGPRNEDKIMNNILKKEVRFPEQTSKDLKSFVTQALQKDPEKRITVKQMLQHAWVCNYKSNQDLDINSLLSR